MTRPCQSVASDTFNYFGVSFRYLLEISFILNCHSIDLHAYIYVYTRIRLPISLLYLLYFLFYYYYFVLPCYLIIALFPIRIFVYCIQQQNIQVCFVYANTMKIHVYVIIDYNFTYVQQHNEEECKKKKK